MWGRACDEQDHCVEATVETAATYRFSVLSALAAAERVLAGGIPPGFHTPSARSAPSSCLQIEGSKVSWGAVKPKSPARVVREARSAARDVREA